MCRHRRCRRLQTYLRWVNEKRATANALVTLPTLTPRAHPFISATLCGLPRYNARALRRWIQPPCSPGKPLGASAASGACQRCPGLRMGGGKGRGAHSSAALRDPHRAGGSERRLPYACANAGCPPRDAAHSGDAMGGKEEKGVGEGCSQTFLQLPSPPSSYIGCQIRHGLLTWHGSRGSSRSNRARASATLLRLAPFELSWPPCLRRARRPSAAAAGRSAAGCGRRSPGWLDDGNGGRCAQCENRGASSLPSLALPAGCHCWLAPHALTSQGASRSRGAAGTFNDGQG